MANIFYVDPENGSNDNDGTSPDNAWASPFVALSSDQSTADDPALIFVRRNTETVISGDDIDLTANPNRIIIGWPQEGDPYYDLRPSAGSDAGWDDDDAVLSKITINNTINMATSTASQFKMFNLEIETSDDNIDYCLKYSIGDIEINNCVINHQRNDDSDSFLSFHRIDATTGQTTLKVINSKLTFDGMLFGCKDDVNWSEVKFSFISQNNEYIGVDNGYAILYWRASYTTFDIYMSNDTINIKTRVLYFNEDNRNLAQITLNVDNVTSISGYEYIYFRDRYKLTAHFKDSFIKVTNASIIYTGHYQSVGYDYKTDAEFTNCKLEASNDVLYFTNTYSSSYGTAVGDIIINSCDINCGRAVVYYASNVNIYTQKFIVNNCSIVADALVYSSNQKGSLSEYTFINIKNSSFSQYVITRVRDIFLIARNSTLGVLESNSDTSSYNTYSLFDCTINGSNHVSSITINGGNISGDYPYAHIDATNVTASLSQNMTGTFRNSKTSALPSKTRGKIELFSCVANDTPMPYAKISYSNVIKASNIIRVNGSEGSISLGTNNSVQGISLERLSFIKPANKSTLIIYLACQNTFPEAFEYISSISYIIDDDGYTYSSNVANVEPSSEEWSGLYEGYKSYKVSFDMPIHDTDVEIYLTLQAFPKNIQAVPSEIYVDLKPDWN